MQVVSPYNRTQRRGNRGIKHQAGRYIRGLHFRRGGTQFRDCIQARSGGRLIALDQDDWALDNAREKLGAYENQVTLVKTNFRDLEQVLKDLDVPMKDGIPQVDGILYDLGVSSPQFDEGERGFSYNHDAPLDMRMDQDALLTAKEIVNEWPEEEIARILYRYGEEKFSKRIARVIVGRRSQSEIETTGELVELIKEGILQHFAVQVDILRSEVFRRRVLL